MNYVQTRPAKPVRPAPTKDPEAHEALVKAEAQRYRFSSLSSPAKEEEKPPPLDEAKRRQLVAEVEKLKMEKQRAVAEEEFETAAALKRRIKVLEDTLGEVVEYEAKKAARQASAADSPPKPPPPKKPLSQVQHGEALWEMPSENMKLVPEEREFIQRSRVAQMRKGVTDDLVNGVPEWAYKDILQEGVKGVKTERPAELQYVFSGAIEDEKWEDGANFQTSFMVQAPTEVAFGYVAAPDFGRTGPPGTWLEVDSDSYIVYHHSGTAQLTEFLTKETLEHELVVLRVTVTKPRVRGLSRLEAAKTAATQEAILRQPFYSFRSVWRFQPDASGGTRVTRIIFNFKQFELPDFDALAAVSRAIEVENEGLRRAWSTTLAIAPDKTLALAGKRNLGGGSAMAAGWMQLEDEEEEWDPSIPASLAFRPNWALRQMPEILDHAAKNHVLEVREMLEVQGADPNYIHVRKDSWAISDSRLEFYEELTPLVVAAEHGACEVIKVLFNHPQLDVNLCCCAFNDLEIYNYYTAYDMTISKKHPHAAALLRARGVLPASSEHVYKPPFDRVHGRPQRATVNHLYGDEDDYGEGEMPSWEVVSQGNPRLAEELTKVADALSRTRSQSKENRARLFKALIADWHPDKHTSTGQAEIATKVFQWLQVVKTWYLEAEPGAAGNQQELPGLDNPDRPTPPTGAEEFLHPSGSVFSVW